MSPDGSMAAVYIESYGNNNVLRSGPRPIPSIKSDQVLIKVHAIGVNPRDWLVREGRYPFRYLLPAFPIILGSDVAGVVVAIGRKVTAYAPGDEVYASQTATGGMGAYSEYLAVHHRSVAFKPANLSFVDSAAVPLAALTSWQALTGLSQLDGHKKVLIIGGSGGCGSFGIQFAHMFGAEVTAVCSGRNQKMVSALGAYRVIDYTTQAFQDVPAAYDIVYDTIGRESLESCRKVMSPRGIYITTVPRPQNMKQALLSRLRPGPTAKVVMVRADGSQLQQIAEHLEAGRIRVIVDRVYPLSKAAEALDYSRTFHTRGRLILVPDSILETSATAGFQKFDGLE